VREQPVQDLKSCVSLLDRFLDGGLRYPLEWDDFVSWTHQDPTIEAARVAVAATEPLFFSGDDAKRAKAVEIVVAERNRIAVMAGMPERARPMSPTGNAT